jgi:hypothetical protein
LQRLPFDVITQIRICCKQPASVCQSSFVTPHLIYDWVARSIVPWADTSRRYLFYGVAFSGVFPIAITVMPGRPAELRSPVRLLCSLSDFCCFFTIGQKAAV